MSTLDWNPHEFKSRNGDSEDAMPETYEVTVWTHDGDVEEVLWNATAEEADAMREKYEDEPLYTVIVEPR